MNRILSKNQNIENSTNKRHRKEKRFKSFDEDIKHWYDYDYIIVNKNLDICFKQIESIISLSKSNLVISSRTIQ